MKVYLPSPDGKAYYLDQVRTWLRSHGHSMWRSEMDWRPLLGHQCHARDSYLQGTWVWITKMSAHDQDVYERGVLTLMKLTWG